MKHTTINNQNMSIFCIIRKSRWTKVIAFLLAIEMLTGNIAGQQLIALTSGPSQPEATNFQPADISNLVDPFSGDFSYNIPVMEIGGYPINLAYASGISMDQEATWVGLGWNLNTGAITRNMRGLPDDFKGDAIVKDYSVKDNKTFGVNVGLGVEIAGFPLSASYGMDVSYNNYNGFNISQTFNPTISAGAGGKSHLNVGLGLTSSSSGGLTIAPSVSFSGQMSKKGRNELTGGIGIGLSMNSRSGMGNLTLDGSYSASTTKPLRPQETEAGNQIGEHRNLGSANLIGASISFATPSFSPTVQPSFRNEAFTFNGMVGVGFGTVDTDIKAGGYYSGQILTTKQTKSYAYGYLYSEKGQGVDNAMHDFNREKDGTYNPKTTTKLAVTNYTYDVLQIQAQGLGGSIRPFRNDVSYIHDQTNTSPSTSGSFGFEISTGNVFDGGINASITHVDSESGLWSANNSANGNMPFKSRLPNDVTEKVHFRMAGEPTVNSYEDFYTKTGSDKAVRFTLDHQRLENNFLDSSGDPFPFHGSITRQNRQRRTSSVEYLTVAEVKKLYPHRAKYLPTYAKAHHIAQITVVKPDGSRYVFGLPAYNKVQKEVSFAVGTTTPDAPAISTIDNTSVAYTTTDNSINNVKGIDNRYDCTTTPAYVHTWYLTEVLSADYVDVTGDGPTDDDIGNYTVFQYGNYDAGTGKYVADVQNYKWRTPTSKASLVAGYNKNLHTDLHDDVANILYGEKDVWYVHNIKSKTQVCEFTFSNRDDGYGVTGIDGGTATVNPLKKIDKISLYSKEDWLKEHDPANTTYVAVPIKTAHFNYDYSLCENVPNNVNTGANSGKLTLKSVWFTFEKSGRARYNPYTFDYSDSEVKIGGVSADLNPEYSMEDYDRWGNYKPQPGGTNAINSEFPYTQQDKEKQDVYAQVWSLQKITLPSGGIINVDYESDDYGYVQDRQACKMFKVVGAGANVAATPTNKLFIPSITDNVYLFFNLDNTIPISVGATSAANQIKIRYLNGLKTNADGTKFIYFRFYTNVDGFNTNKKEYVSGYAEIEDVQPKQSTGSTAYDMGAIKLKGVDIQDAEPGNYNPIAKAAWQFSRVQTPRSAFHQVDPTDDSFEGIMTSLSNSSFLTTIVEMFDGVNTRLYNEHVGSDFDPQKSWIRLTDPDGCKYGGGHRVKHIYIDDDWNTATGGDETSFSYGQTYTYQTEHGKSSGVAPWEPSMGADENPFRLPIYMTKHMALVPDEEFYLEEPMGECFFPSPGVGYSRVTIQNDAHAGVNVNGTGKVVHEFYTAKDFPTKINATELAKDEDKSDFPFTLLVNFSWDNVAVSQGYTVINNDMHGKAKAQSIYDQSGTLITQTSYEYKRNGDNLINDVSVIDNQGVVSEAMIGVDFDLVADMREMKTKTQGAGAQVNVAMFLIGVFPLAIPSLFPDLNNEETRFRSGTTTKVIFRTGILEKTIVKDKGAIVSTENVAYDKSTGDVLLTRVNNEYGDERYAVNFPAHWAYDRMGFASDNWGFIFKIPHGSPTDVWDYTDKAFVDGTAIENMLVPGDELVQYDYTTNTPVGIPANTANTNRYWVSADNDGKKHLIIWDGSVHQFPTMPLNDIYFKVVRSGRRNMPAASIGSAEVLGTPLASGVLNLTGKQVLNTGAQEYSENWRTKHIRTNVQEYSQMTCSPNIVGTRMLMLFNELIDNNEFVQNYAFPAADADVSLTYGGYNTTGLIPPPPGCEYKFNSVATGYTPPWGSVAGLTNNAWMQLYFLPKQAACSNCASAYLISIADQAEFQVDDFDEIQYFSSVITIDNYLDLSGVDPYLYMVANPDDLFITRALMNDGTTKDFLLYNNCPLFDIQSNCCPISERYACETDGIVNPYLAGILGNWRPFKSHTYLTDRTPATLGTALIDRRTSGYYALTNYFWQQSGDFWVPTSDAKWKYTSEVTAYNPGGGEIENMNPLGIYSSAVYGYKQTLPIIVAQNAKYKEIGFDGFEDYFPLVNTSLPCVKEHFKLSTDYWGYLTQLDAHTGNNSLLFDPAEPAPKFTYTTSAVQSRNTTLSVPFVLSHNDVLTSFSPDDIGADKRFVVSFWAKMKTSNFNTYQLTHSYNDLRMVVNLEGWSGPLNVPATPSKGPIINGWQKFQYVFPIYSTGTTGSDRDIEFTFESDGTVYFIDDVRVHPFDATAKSFVYNSRNLRFMAELDENNYATFYEYDDEGALVRVKKETERGIMTLKENRNYTVKRKP